MKLYFEYFVEGEYENIFDNILQILKSASEDKEYLTELEKQESLLSKKEYNFPDLKEVSI